MIETKEQAPGSLEMFHVKHYERGWSEMLKITRDLIQPDLCYLELDGRNEPAVGTAVYLEVQ